MPKSEQVEELLKSNPDDIFLQYALAMAYVSEGNATAAQQQFVHVIERHPDHVAAYFQLSQQLARQGSVAEARRVITDGIEAAKRVGDSHAQAEMTGFLETLTHRARGQN